MLGTVKSGLRLIPNILGLRTLWAMIELLDITSNLEIATVKKTGMRKKGVRVR
jgi:hypothetical protein